MEAWDKNFQLNLCDSRQNRGSWKVHDIILNSYLEHFWCLNWRWYNHPTFVKSKIVTILLPCLIKLITSCLLWYLKTVVKLIIIFEIETCFCTLPIKLKLNKMLFSSLNRTQKSSTQNYFYATQLSHFEPSFFIFLLSPVFSGQTLPASSWASSRRTASTLSTAPPSWSRLWPPCVRACRGGRRTAPPPSHILHLHRTAVGVPTPQIRTKGKSNTIFNIIFFSPRRWEKQQKFFFLN